MARLPVQRAPLWFVVLVSIAVPLLWRELAPAPLGHGGAGAHDGAPLLAFWGWIIVLAEALWKGAEVAGRVVLAILQYSVQLLWRGLVLLGRGAMELAHYSWVALKKGWHLLKLTYTNILKPAWKFVWRWVDKAELWLKRTFGPLMKWLRRFRTMLLDIYGKYVKPVLDIIEVTRRGARLLGTLGVQWARTLDAKLGLIEERIDLIPRLMIAELNKIINIVDRIMTADGLFQRLTFLRTLARDYAHAWNMLVGAFSTPLSVAVSAETKAKVAGKPLEQVTRDVREYMQDHAGADAGLFDEMTTQWRKQLQGR